MSSNEHPVTRSVYVVVLDKDLPSPLAPESDEESGSAEESRAADADKNKDDKEQATTNEAKDTPVTVQDGHGRNRPAHPRACRYRRATTSDCCRARPACCS